MKPETLIEALREALANLYDPLRLRKSPLLSWLGLARDPDPAHTLRAALLAEIEALKPNGEAPPEYARYYHTLYLRYVQGLTEADVANQLGLSPRHLRRVQAMALERLADQLRQRFPTAQTQISAAGEEGDPTPAEAIQGELAWLRESLIERISAPDQVIAEALPLTQRLAQQQGIALQWSATALPQVEVPATVLKQIVLGLVTMALKGGSGGKILLAARAERDGVLLAVRAQRGIPSGRTPPTWDAEQLEMSRRLAELFKGEFSFVAKEQWAQATVWLPAAKPVKVLALEDNLDTLQLWERYLAQTRFQLLVERNPANALEAVKTMRPDVIVLDIMLPGVDGWDLLAQLRHHPATGGIPIIVCTVLPQKELALSLGASDFIRKPATRSSLLEALERQSAASALG